MPRRARKASLRTTDVGAVAVEMDARGQGPATGRIMVAAALAHRKPNAPVLVLAEAANVTAAPNEPLRKLVNA